MREKDFSIAEIFKMMWNYKLLILSVILILTLFVGIKTIFYTPDTFTANGSIYVSNQGTTTDDNPNSSIIVGDIVTSRILSETYIETLRTRSFMMDVSKSLNGNLFMERNTGYDQNPVCKRNRAIIFPGNSFNSAGRVCYCIRYRRKSTDKTF